LRRLRPARAQRSPGELRTHLSRLVPEDGDHPRRRQQLWRSRRIGGSSKERLAAAGDRRRGGRIVEAGHDRSGFERKRQIRAGRGERRSSAIEHDNRLLEPLCPAERQPQHESIDPGDLGAGCGVDGLLQVLRPVRQTGTRLGHAQIEQQARPCTCGRRLGESAAQQDRLGLGSTLLAGCAGRFDQPLDHPLISGRLAHEQVLSHPLARDRMFRQQPRSSTVTSCALCSRKPGVDAASDDRMDEHQGQPRLEDPRCGQQLGCFGGLRVIQIRKSRRLEKVALLYDRQRPREPARLLGQTAELQLDRSSDRTRADLLDVAGSVRSGSDSALLQCVHEHTHQERASTRLAEAGVDEERIRNLHQGLLDELPHRRPGQRGKPDHARFRVAGHRREQLCPEACLVGPRREDERRVEFLQAREQEREVTEGGAISPLRIVDDQAEGTCCRKVGAEPVEAVQDGERGIKARRRELLDGRGGAGQTEDRGSSPRGPLQQLAALRLGCLGQLGLEQLADDAERELPLELRSPRAQHPHPFARSRLTRRREQRCLPDPSRSLQHDEPASPRAGVGQGRIDPRKFVDPFEQPCSGRMDLQMPPA
jgi:hypothetical protein